MKKNFDNISEAKNDKLIENHVVPLEPMYDKLKQSSKVILDPIHDVVDDICSQIPSPLINFELQNKDDMNLIRQLSSLSCSARVSLQSSSKNLQSTSVSLENDKLHFIKQPMSKRKNILVSLLIIKKR